MGTPTYSGGEAASGTFTGGIASGLGFESGLILTTGVAQDAVGPNSLTDTSTTLGLPGDSGLDSLLPEGPAGGVVTTNDAAILEFDFEAENSDLSFNFVFASEEYQEFVGSNFNDVFGLFVDGENIATIPGSSLEFVTINNVNLDSNSEFFMDNENASLDIEYDGLTTVLAVEALGLDDGIHNLRIAIADTADGQFDSAIFIQGESVTTSTNITPPGVDPVEPPADSEPPILDDTTAVDTDNPVIVDPPFIEEPPVSEPPVVDSDTLPGTEVPEPSTVLLLGAGVLLAGLRRSRKS